MPVKNRFIDAPCKRCVHKIGSMTEFADMTGLMYGLSTYPTITANIVGLSVTGLEKSWNEYLLSTVGTVLNRAVNFLWKGMRTVARLLDAIYEKGVAVCDNKKTELEQRLQRSPVLHWRDITI